MKRLKRMKSVEPLSSTHDEQQQQQQQQQQQTRNQGNQGLSIEECEDLDRFQDMSWLIYTRNMVKYTRLLHGETPSEKTQGGHEVAKIQSSMCSIM